MRALHWFRRDLRVADNEALSSLDPGSAAVFVLDPALLEQHPRRLKALGTALVALDDALEGRLHLVGGDPAVVLPELATRLGLDRVVAHEEATPLGQRRDERVSLALAGAGIALELVGSPYVLSPGSVTKPDGTPYKVFTPFWRAWSARLSEDPSLLVPLPVPVLDLLEPALQDRAGLTAVQGWAAQPDLLPVPLAEPDVTAHLALVASRALDYHESRNRPDRVGTSGLSPALKYGTLHPRTLASTLSATDEGTEQLRRQVAWREFNASLLRTHPAMARQPIDARFRAMEVDSGPRADELFERFATGTTGYPLVDAGVREMLETGLMHNRVRMVVASFLVKDLHLPWVRGERLFAHHLLDADTANNAANWQWVAGCGVDSSPFFRVFNPVGQGERFDPDGDYVRRWVPELAHLAGKLVHRPWDQVDGHLHGYPERVVDHGDERLEALRRLKAMKGS